MISCRSLGRFARNGFYAACGGCRRTRLYTGRPSKRVSQQSVEKHGNPDRSGQQPESDRWKVAPQRQAFPVIDIECRQQQDVGGTHPGDMPSRPALPALTTSQAPDKSGDERTHAEQEQMVVFLPTHDSQGACRRKDSSETPVVCRAKIRMPAGRFPAQHCTRAGDDAGQSDQNMKTDDAQKHRRGRGYLNPRDDRCIGHDVRPHKARVAPSSWVSSTRTGSAAHHHSLGQMRSESPSAHSRAGLDFV